MSEDDYYDQINRVISIFCKYSRHGLISGQIKEKFGSIRWYAEIRRVETLHDIFYNGFYYYQYGADDRPVMNFLDKLSRFYLWPFSGLIFQYQKLMYALAYRKALTECPDITTEILASCEWSELLFKKDKHKHDQLFNKATQ